MTRAPLACLGILMTVAVAEVRAQDSVPVEEARPTGLPKKIEWTFNFDAGLGGFGFNNSLYTNARPDPSGNLSDDWAESFAKPALSASYDVGKGELYGKASVVGERTFAAPPSLVGEDASSFQIEDAYLGWRSGKALGIGENALDFTVGRAPYTLGHGLLLWDGGGEGGSRGGFWSNARKAWEFAAIGRFKPKNHTFEVFYLDRDEVPESQTGTKVFGVNYQLALGEATTIGASYLRWDAKQSALPARDGLNVYNARLFTSPLRKVPDLAFEGEFAREENGDLRGSTAWNAQASYTLSKVKWQPRISYRYAFFEGDDPGTTKNEGFDALIPGFYDWGTWWQGEIGGEYFLANSNLISHQVRLHVTPASSVGAGLIGYVFQADQPIGPGITSKDLLNEIDAYCDWKINKNFTASFVAAFAQPKDAVKQAFNRSDDFTYGMIYLAYSY